MMIVLCIVLCCVVLGEKCECAGRGENRYRCRVCGSILYATGNAAASQVCNTSHSFVDLYDPGLGQNRTDSLQADYPLPGKWWYEARVALSLRRRSPMRNDVDNGPVHESHGNHNLSGKRTQSCRGRPSASSDDAPFVHDARK